MFSKRERESGGDIQRASAHSARERLLSLTTLIVPRVDSSIHSFWSTRRTLGLIKACREVSYWTQDCFLIPSTLTILVNRTPIQLPAWAFFFPTGFLLGLIFKVNAQMPRKAFSLSAPPPPSPSTSPSLHTALPHSVFVLEVHAKSNMREAETISGTLPPPPVSQHWVTWWEIFPSPLSS